MSDIKVNISKKTSKTNQISSKKPKKTTKNKKNLSSVPPLFSNLLAMAILAAIVGGIVYAWQNSVKEKNIKEAKNVTRRVKEDFEKKIAILENKVEKIQKENLELKKKKEELESKLGILSQAKTEFNNSELGLYFLYPAVWGDVNWSIEKDKWNVSWTENASLVLGGTTKRYIATNTKEFIELNLNKKRSKYYLEFYVNGEKEENEVLPQKVIAIEGGREAVLLNRNSISETDNLPVKLADNMLLAFIQLEKGDYPVAVFVDKDIKKLPEKDFLAIIKTIQIK